jgi:hypothetical protein
VSLGPAQIHPEQHLGPVLRFGAPGTRLDIDKRVVLIELTREHAPELELLDRLLGAGEIALDITEQLRVVFGTGEFEQFGSIAQGLVELRDRRNDIAQGRALAAQALGTFRRRPDRRVLEFALDFLEPFTLDVVVKDTP